MNPSDWGPQTWHMLHAISFNYPNRPTAQEKEAYRQFFHSLKYVLPCERCRVHFTRELQEKNPVEPHLESRESLSRWLVNLHNEVNRRLHKPNMPYDQVLKKFKMQLDSDGLVTPIPSTVNTKTTGETFSNQCRACAPCNTADDQTSNSALMHIIFVLLAILVILIAYMFYCKRGALKALE